MGITGLLPFLEQATKPCHISEFRGATCAIDTYCWLHRGANSCAVQLAQGEDTKAYVHYCMKFVKMLQSYDIRPILVFDGKNLPAKAETESKRREGRTKAKQRAAELLRLGKTEEAKTYLKQSINITPDMASAVIKECHKINVDCIVAPYEADAQLAYLNLKGIAEIIITEDSDLVLFGCSKVMFKLDFQGCCYLVDASKIPEAMKLRPDKYTFDKFRYMCILSGCDYIESLRGIGLKKAHKFITLTEETNPQKFLGKVPRYLNMQHLQITEEYKENFMIADATFRHQTVFDPIKKKLVPLTDPEVCGTNPKYCKNAGEIYDHEKAYQIAIGNLHPTKPKQLDNWTPDVKAGSSASIWSGVYQKSVSRREQKTKFKEFFKSSSKTEQKEIVIDEQVKMEEDIVIAKELEFYSRKSSESTEISISKEIAVKEEENDEAPLSEPTSPILKRNPFLIKKKLSKFHLTKTDSKVIVKSRYFCSNSVEEKMEIKEESSEVEGTQTDVENIPCNGNNEMKSKPNGEERDEEDTLKEISDDVVDLSIDESNEEVVPVEKTTERLELNSQEKSGESSNLKRKKLGPCRTLGLKRTKSANQHTLHSFFSKMKRD